MVRIILEGLVISFSLDDFSAIIFCSFRGLPWMVTFSLFSIKWLIVLLVIFYGTGKIFAWLERGPITKMAKERLKGSGAEGWINYPRKKGEEVKMKITEWLGKRKKLIIFLACLPIPFPYLGSLVGPLTAAMIAAMKIKYGFLLLSLATLFKAFVLCSLVYYFFS